MPFKDGRLIYESVIDAPNKSKIDLYNSARQWFVDYFKSSKDVIQNEDKEQGRIVGKGIIFVYLSSFGGKYKYNDQITIQIDIKDNKYRYRIYDSVVQTVTQNGFSGKAEEDNFAAEQLLGKILGTDKMWITKKQAKTLLESMDLEIKLTLTSLTTAMKAKGDTF